MDCPGVEDLHAAVVVVHPHLVLGAILADGGTSGRNAEHAAARNDHSIPWQQPVHSSALPSSGRRDVARIHLGDPGAAGRRRRPTLSAGRHPDRDRHPNCRSVLRHSRRVDPAVRDGVVGRRWPTRQCLATHHTAPHRRRAVSWPSISSRHRGRLESVPAARSRDRAVESRRCQLDLTSRAGSVGRGGRGRVASGEHDDDGRGSDRHTVIGADRRQRSIRTGERSPDFPPPVLPSRHRVCVHHRMAGRKTTGRSSANPGDARGLAASGMSCCRGGRRRRFL